MDVYHRESRAARNSRARNWHQRNHEQSLLTTAKARARKFGVPFSIVVEDIIVPKVCPVLGIPLFRTPNKRTDNTPSLDRVNPKLGYVKGNIQIISWRANRLKCDASFEEIEQLYEYMKNNR
jgi:hypothetical protein